LAIATLASIYELLLKMVFWPRRINYELYTLEKPNVGSMKMFGMTTVVQNTPGIGNTTQ
jgi:hypothetical protein